MNAQLLEQQVRLNQLQHLQQLQQQIFQQQMAIINGQDYQGPPSIPPSPEIALTQPHSAPEHVAFNVYRRSFYVPSTVPEAPDISPMPSPYLAGEPSAQPQRKRSSRNKSDDPDDPPRRSKPYRGSRSTNSTPFLGSSAPYPPPHPHHQPRQPSISITHAPSVPGSASSLPSASYDTPSPVDLGEALAPPLDPSTDKGRESPSAAHLMPPPPLPPSSMDVDDVAALNNQQMIDYMGMIDMGLNMNFPQNLMDGFPPSQQAQHQHQQHQEGQAHMDDLISGINWPMDDFHRQSHQHPQPATPASIMNIGRLHHHPQSSIDNQTSLSATPASTAPTTPASAFAPSVPAVPLPLSLPAAAVPSSAPPAGLSSPTSKPTPTRAKRTNSTAARAVKDASSKAAPSGAPSTATPATTKRNSKAATPSMKPILPAGMSPSLQPSNSNSNTNSSTSSLPPLTPLPPSATASPAINPTQPTLAIRKTSHKAAEQKRRDSLKTTFDDLRKLLPPIALPNSTAEDLAASLSDPTASTSTSAFPYFLLAPPNAPLLPGAKPPRGPPKTGAAGDDLGPNKGVSKLQLLICGNEFIRMMKGRVERRDDEIARLRKEVRRLQALVGPSEGEEDQEFEVERDLDACERERFLAEIKDGARDREPRDEDMDDADDE